MYSLKNRLLLLCSLLICLCSIACSERQPPKLAALHPNAVILALGDSLTFGNHQAGQSYPEILQSLTKRQVINAGIPGEISKKTLARLNKELSTHRPNLVILCIGGNDILRRMSEQELKSNINAILDTLQQQGISVILMGVPKLSMFLSPHPIYQEIAHERNIWLTDIVTDTLQQDELKSDLIHPNEAGYQKIAEDVFALLKKSGAL